MLEKNKKVGNYILLEKLGTGGFGEVWKAEKRTSLSVSLFALKFFRPNDDEKIDLESVRKEVETWQSLSGLPNVISVVEADVFENYVYIVSDFAESGSLEKWLKENEGKANSVEEAVTITRQILHGLEGMHRAGFVHRDLKPANILIKKGVIYLADFGISREMKTHSKTTSTAGTYEFMPPEAFDKKPTVSVHTDIWAVGVILQKLLTGKLPFPQDEIPSLISGILMGEPEPLPQTVPGELREIVNKALQKKREDRFQWAREMSDALRNAVNTKETNQNQKASPTVPIPNPSAEKTVKFEVEPIQDRQELTRQAQPKKNEETLKLAGEKKNEETLKLPNEKWMESQLTVQSQPQPAQINKIKRDIVRVPPPNLVKKTPPMPKVKAGANRNLRLGVAAMFLVGIIAAVAYFTFNSGNAPKSVENKVVTKTPSNLPNNFKNSIGMEFIKIPAGTFVMGSPSNEWQRDKSESPQREVVIGYEFYLGKYEVTQEEYEKIMGTNPSTFKNCPRCPVENVSWNDAKDFLAKLNAKNDGYDYRLPSEAEWEHAARAGTVTPFSIGDGNNLSSDQANFDGRNPFRDAPKGRYLERTTTVGSYPPNPFGLYDMNGNVWEWCEDIYQENYNGLGTDGSANLRLGNANARILRGGSWINIGNGLRSAVRLGNPINNRLSYNGFRVAVTIK